MEDQINDWKKEHKPLKKIDHATLNSIESLAVNDIQNQFLSGDHDGLIKIWDFERFVQVDSIRGHTKGIWSLDVTSDGKTLLSGSNDRSLILWDYKSKKKIQQLQKHQNNIHFCTFNEKDQLIASGGEDGKIIIWDVRKGSALKTIQSDNKIVYQGKFSGCGNYLFTAEYGGQTKCFETKNFSLTDTYGKFNEDSRAWAIDCDFSQNSKFDSVYVGDEIGNLKKLNFKNGKYTFDYQFMTHLDAIKCITLNSKKNQILTCCGDGTVRLVSGSKDEMFNRNSTIGSLIGHITNTSSGKFSDKHNLIVTGGWDSTICVFKNDF